jgi:hypothetical protein
MPAKAGIQKIRAVLKPLDPGFRRGDDFFGLIIIPTPNPIDHPYSSYGWGNRKF